jgi:uncharacterized protein (DUF1810 family)
VKEKNPHTLLVGMQASTTTVENNMETLQKTKNRTAIPLLGICPKECVSVYNQVTRTSMFTAVLFTIAKL